MWKRLQGHVRDGHFREKDKQVGNPVLVSTTYDEDKLRNIPNVADAQNASYQAGPVPDMIPQYDSLSPHDPDDYRYSEVPTVSSFYSQPSPEMRSNYAGAAPTHSGFVDISPPSSPEPDEQRHRNPNQPRRFRSMRDVSPVDETRGQRPGPGSNIPVLRKAPPGIRDGAPPNTQKFWGGKVAPNSKVRWDEYSGEPTSSNVGKPGQVNPLAYAKDSLSPPSDRMGYHVSVTGPQDIQKGTSPDRGRFRSKSPVDNTVAKPPEPWSRTSGRAEIVKPFKHQPAQQKPLNFQRKTVPKPVAGSDKNTSSSLAPAAKHNPMPADTAPVANNPGDVGKFDMHENPIKPTVPLKAGRNSPPRSPTSPHNPVNQASKSYPSPLTPTNKQPLPPARASEQGESNDDYAQDYSTPLYSKTVRKSIDDSPDSHTGKDNGPTSRFSWTTYNTNTTSQRSPPPSPPPPLPVSTDPIPAASSILNRRRPLGASDKVPSRKPVSTTTANAAMNTSNDPPSPRPDSTFSTATQKALPRPPTEITAADHVDTLEAQMEDLRIRRSNVFRLLKDLNNMAPPNPLVTDFKRMRLVDRRKKEFEDELAEIKREEHDVGLKLHRAYRKRENADPGSESAIWIRRVTR